MRAAVLRPGAETEARGAGEEAAAHGAGGEEAEVPGAGGEGGAAVRAGGAPSPHSLSLL